MSRKLEGKVALISGGTSGIGAATARLFQSEGATVIVTGGDPARAEAAKKRLPGIEVVVSDAGKVSDVRALVQAVKDRHGRIDVLFANAGVADFKPIAEVDEAEFDRYFDINVKGLYFLAQGAAPLIPVGGSIIFTASVVASLGYENASVYSATKAAVRSFGRTFARELAPRGVTVNTISPGPIETPIFNKSGWSQEQIEGFVQGAASRVPLGRIGQPEEVAKAALFLAADAPFTTGTELLVDGGLVDL
jgi:NAD(P)-dependent dehydrogenase (short-subunit alcohol dehydrogenase family)